MVKNRFCFAKPLAPPAKDERKAASHTFGAQYSRSALRVYFSQTTLNPQGLTESLTKTSAYCYKLIADMCQMKMVRIKHEAAISVTINALLYLIAALCQVKMVRIKRGSYQCSQSMPNVIDSCHILDEDGENKSYLKQLSQCTTSAYCY